MKFTRFASSLALLFLFSVTSNAATTTLFGDDVSFTFDDSSLFGEAIVVGNSIFFQPTDFRAESLNGEGTVSANATLNITVEVLDAQNYSITELAMVEIGDYFLSSGDTSVTASGRLQVTSGTSTCGFFPCLDSEVFNVGGLTTVGSTTDWQGGTQISLADTAGWGSDTELTAQIQNNLSATTLNGGEQAWIQKKAGGVGLEVSVVPIPAAVWLFGSALGLLGWMRRRGASQS